jgi:plastocyanin
MQIAPVAGRGTIRAVTKGKRIGTASVALVAWAAVALVLVPAAGADRERPAAASLRGTTTVRVRMVDDAFRPRNLTISRGTRVRWVNAGNSDHSSTATGRWDSGLLDRGETYRRVFRQSGTFPYFCTAHPGMRGTITVT